MKVRELMTRDVETIAPGDSIEEAACIMAAIDAGALPVRDGERLIGMLTDRDIAIRAIARGRGPETRVGDVMTPEVKYCFEDEDLNHVVQNMGEIQVRRLPVMNREKRLVGILSIGDIATADKPVRAGAALRGIAQSSDRHNQTA